MRLYFCCCDAIKSYSGSRGRLFEFVCRYTSEIAGRSNPVVAGIVGSDLFHWHKWEQRASLRDVQHGTQLRNVLLC